MEGCFEGGVPSGGWRKTQEATKARPGHVALFSTTCLSFNAVSKVLLGEVPLSVERVSKKVPGGHRLPGTFIVDLSCVGDLSELLQDDYTGWVGPSAAVKHFRVEGKGEQQVVREVTKAAAHSKVVCCRFAADAPFRGLLRKLYVAAPLHPNANFSYNLAAITFSWKAGRIPFRVSDAKLAPAVFVEAADNSASPKKKAKLFCEPPPPSTSKVQLGGAGEKLEREVLLLEAANQGRMSSLLDRFEGFLDRLESLSHGGQFVPPVQERVEVPPYQEQYASEFWIGTEQDVQVEREPDAPSAVLDVEEELGPFDNAQRSANFS